MARHPFFHRSPPNSLRLSGQSRALPGPGVNWLRHKKQITNQIRCAAGSIDLHMYSWLSLLLLLVNFAIRFCVFTKPSRLLALQEQQQKQQQQQHGEMKTNSPAPLPAKTSASAWRAASRLRTSSCSRAVKEGNKKQHREGVQHEVKRNQTRRKEQYSRKRSRCRI